MCVDDRFKSIRPGWKTVRGRIYIKHGPPDEIESHPARRTYAPPGGTVGFSSIHPFEVWRYRKTGRTGAETLVEFIDSDSDGEYSLRGAASRRGFQ